MRAVLLSFCLTFLSAAGAAEDAALWNVAWITDTQTPECEWITALVNRVAVDKPEMVIHTGDTRFEWANQCAWKDVVSLQRSSSPAIEFHLAPGNHDLTNGVLEGHLRRAATKGIYRMDTGMLAEGKGYYHKRVPENVSGPLWPTWNPEVLHHPGWQTSANQRPERHTHPDPPYRYVFKRGGIRFIVADCYYTEDQRDWIRNLIVQPDDSSATIILQHKHEVDALAKYVEGLEGRHNVRLILSGDHHNYCYEERHGVTFITSAGMANGHWRDSDAMTLWVFKDRLQLDRYIIRKGLPMPPIEGPMTIWGCEGSFAEYERPGEWGAVEASANPSAGAVRAGQSASNSQTVSPNLIYNGDFDNHIWYERFRGWSPSGWYQWFTRGDDAPEHAVGKDRPHSGKEYVRIHMWAHAWRGGVLQTIRNVEPCHWYQLTAYGWFAPEGSSNPRERIGLDPCGLLAGQFSADVTKHPAPPYDEGVGDDAKTPEVDGPDIPETTVWSDYHDYYDWGKFEVSAEARSATMMVILYCNPDQRPAEKPIYEMNWDSAALREIPWPTKRLVSEGETLRGAEGFKDLLVKLQPELRTAEVTWETTTPAGASQVLYRFLDSDAVNHYQESEQVRPDEFPFQTPVHYERSARRHRIQINELSTPEQAQELQVVTLSRVLMGGECKTLASSVYRYRIE